MQNGLQLNPDKSEALFMGTATQLRAVSSLTSVSVSDVDLPVADSMRVLGVTLDRRLTFDNHASAVARSCNYHARAIRHIRHLLTLDLAQTLACSLILSRIDYCISVLHGAPSSNTQKLQRVKNNAVRIVLQAHWLASGPWDQCAAVWAFPFCRIKFAGSFVAGICARSTAFHECHSWNCVVAASASFYDRRDRAVPMHRLAIHRSRCVARMPYSQVFEPLLAGLPHLIV